MDGKTEEHIDLQTVRFRNVSGRLLPLVSAMSAKARAGCSPSSAARLARSPISKAMRKRRPVTGYTRRADGTLEIAHRLKIPNPTLQNLTISRRRNPVRRRLGKRHVCPPSRSTRSGRLTRNQKNHGHGRHLRGLPGVFLTIFIIAFVLALHHEVLAFNLRQFRRHPALGRHRLHHRRADLGHDRRSYRQAAYLHCHHPDFFHLQPAAGLHA